MSVAKQVFHAQNILSQLNAATKVTSGLKLMQAHFVKAQVILMLCNSANNAATLKN